MQTLTTTSSLKVLGIIDESLAHPLVLLENQSTNSTTVRPLLKRMSSKKVVKKIVLLIDEREVININETHIKFKGIPSVSPKHVPKEGIPLITTEMLDIDVETDVEDTEADTEVRLKSTTTEEPETEPEYEQEETEPVWARKTTKKKTYFFPFLPSLNEIDSDFKHPKAIKY